MSNLENKRNKLQNLINEVYDGHLFIGMYDENGEDTVDGIMFGGCEDLAMGLATVALDEGNPDLAERVRNALFASVLMIMSNDDPSIPEFFDVVEKIPEEERNRVKECIKIELNPKNKENE